MEQKCGLQLQIQSSLKIKKMSDVSHKTTHSTASNLARLTFFLDFDLFTRIFGQ